jgi:predicted DNA-binding transcriptional regulator AlpA
MTHATITASALAELLQVSEWSIYQSVRRGDCPVPPIKVGRRLVWSRVAVDRLLGLDPPEPPAA